MFHDHADLPSEKRPAMVQGVADAIDPRPRHEPIGIRQWNIRKRERRLDGKECNITSGDLVDDPSLETDTVKKLNGNSSGILNEVGIRDNNAPGIDNDAAATP